MKIYLKQNRKDKEEMMKIVLLFGDILLLFYLLFDGWYRRKLYLLDEI